VTKATFAVSAALLALAATGCHGSSSQKAGGSPAQATKPLVLTLFTGDSLFAPEYAAAVERLSHATMRIDVTVAGNEPDYEHKTVDAVRRGTYELGSVGARVWDSFGVTSFQALLAPFLVDSLVLEQRVLEGPLAARMIAGVDRTGVVGLAVLPGPLRRPLGVSRRLVAPRDYRGATIAIRFGGVARATFAALGATSRGYNIGVLPSVDGAELDLNTIASNGYDAHASALTANVVLWPRPQTIFMNRAAFDRLTPQQQEILGRAGRAALAPELARIERDELTGLAGVCGRGSVALASASPTDLAGLRRTVQPVYEKLERDPLARTMIREISKLRDERAAPIDVVRCRAPASEPAAARVEGLWRLTSSRSELVAAGAPPAEAQRQQGQATLELKAGRWRGREANSGFAWKGTYAVEGNVMRFVTTACEAPADVCFRGESATFTWSVYRDTLSLGPVSGPLTYFGLVAKPLTRVR
jgi:TRAP-type C4-dicarboxylate transport system substrate-binding protein